MAHRKNLLLVSFLSLAASLVMADSVLGQPPSGSRWGGPRRGGARPKPGDMFDRMDANKDRKLTKNEVPGHFWQRLNQADANGDGAISKIEFVVHMRATKNRGGRQGGLGNRPGPGQDVDGGQPEPRGPRQRGLGKRADKKLAGDDDSLAKRKKGSHLHLGVFSLLDGDDNGEITKDEVWEILSKADADEDGKITKEEFEKHREEFGKKVNTTVTEDEAE